MIDEGQVRILVRCIINVGKKQLRIIQCHSWSYYCNKSQIFDAEGQKITVATREQCLLMIRIIVDSRNMWGVYKRWNWCEKTIQHSAAIVIGDGCFLVKGFCFINTACCWAINEENLRFNVGAKPVTVKQVLVELEEWHGAFSIWFGNDQYPKWWCDINFLIHFCIFLGRRCR